jgi:hypothetical protein
MAHFLVVEDEKSINGDSVLLQFLLVNLIDNAVKTSLNHIMGHQLL